MVSWRISALARGIIAAGIIGCSWSATARAEPEPVIAPSQSCIVLHVVLDEQADPEIPQEHARWFQRQSPRIVAKAFGAAYAIVMDFPPVGVTAAYDVSIAISRSDVEYRVVATFTQSGNPTVTPAIEERTFRGFPEREIERFLAEIALLFARLGRITGMVVLPALVAPQATDGASEADRGLASPHATPSASERGGDLAADAAVAAAIAAIPPEPIVTSASDADALALAGVVAPAPDIVVEVRDSSPWSWWRISGAASIAVGGIAFGIVGWQYAELRDAGEEFQATRVQLAQEAARDRGTRAHGRMTTAAVAGGVLVGVGAAILAADIFFNTFGSGASASAALDGS